MRAPPEYLIEFIQVGSHLKVSAVDPITLTEISMIGDPRASRENLSRLAVQKLEYMLAKKKP
jgi:hypothetical protein